ncbi:MAG: ATP-binding cassette domain-containing protein [Candidatus Eisenbacteria bacterium]|nr:ATP-binding cassette domain-containing protein [Candidatus Eisenbacteria bacterium]
MLEVHEVTKTYDDRAVVNAVSFDVQPGEIFALLGPNGAGKTTLIRMITDILKPDSGTITLNGAAVGGDLKRRIAYLPEERGLYRRMRVTDALSYYGELKGMSRQAARSAAASLLDRVALRESANLQVQALSKGMQQKLQLCTALIGDPKLLILDEPFTGLDPINVQLFEEVLQERRAAGATVLLSTHQMNKVEQLCDRALMINRGHMVLYGEVREIRRRYAGHAVRLRASAMPDSAPGVTSIAEINGEHELTLASDATPAAVLRALLDRGANVESFALSSLPLEDIFVRVVQEGVGLDRGQSGPPTVDVPLRSGGAR